MRLVEKSGAAYAGKPEGVEARSATLERSRKLSITGSYPALVRGVDDTGQEFEESIKLGYLSRSGTSLRLLRCVALGARLFIVVRVMASSYQTGLTPCVAVHGIARHVERQPDGSCTVGVEFGHHRFLDPIDLSSASL